MRRAAKAPIDPPMPIPSRMRSAVARSAIPVTLRVVAIAIAIPAMPSAFRAAKWPAMRAPAG